MKVLSFSARSSAAPPSSAFIPAVSIAGLSFRAPLAKDSVLFGARPAELDDPDDAVALVLLQKMAAYLADPELAAMEKVTEEEAGEFRVVLGLLPPEDPKTRALLAEVFKDQPGLAAQHETWQPANPFADRLGRLEELLKQAIRDQNGFLILVSVLTLKLAQSRQIFGKGTVDTDALFANIKPSLLQKLEAAGEVPKTPDPIAYRSLKNLAARIYEPEFLAKQGDADRGPQIFKMMLAAIPDEKVVRELCSENPRLLEELPQYRNFRLPPFNERPIEDLTPAERVRFLEDFYLEAFKIKNSFVLLAAMLILHTTQRLGVLPAGRLKTDNPFAF